MNTLLLYIDIYVYAYIYKYYTVTITERLVSTPIGKKIYKHCPHFKAKFAPNL